MHKTSLVAVALLFSTGSWAGAPGASATTGGFAGTIDIKVSAPQGAGGTAKLHVGEGGVASEVEMGQDAKSRFKARTVMPKGSDTMILIDDAQKMYREIDMKAAREMQASARADEKWTITKKGSAKIREWNTTHIAATSSKGQQLEAWTTKDIGDSASFAKVFGEHAKLSDGLMSALDKEGVGGIPVKMVTKTPDGDVMMEVTAVSKKAPPASTFQVPKDYKKQTAPVMPISELTPEQKKMLEEQMKKLPKEQQEELKKSMGK